MQINLQSKAPPSITLVKGYEMLIDLNQPQTNQWS